MRITNQMMINSSMANIQVNKKHQEWEGALKLVRILLSKAFSGSLLGILSLPKCTMGVPSNMTAFPSLSVPQNCISAAKIPE